MLRLPPFSYVAARSVAEAADLLAASPDASILAGGTDLLPNMKRRQQTPATLVGIRAVRELTHVSTQADEHGAMTIGAGVTLARLVAEPRIRTHATALWQAASQIATPQLRNMGTLGGNLCLDTRCTYWDRSAEWRKAIGFCLKRDGETCWVAPGSRHCLAVSSTDAAPALIALGASVELAAVDGVRQIRLADFYRHDGIEYLARRRNELLTRVHIPVLEGWRSTYWKLRRRGAFDFPVLSVAAAVRLASDGSVTDARIVVGAVASRPIEVPDAARTLVGRPLSDAAIADASERTAKPAKPMDNTDFALIWRKRVVRDVAGYALRELRGDDVRVERRRVAHVQLAAE